VLTKTTTWLLVGAALALPLAGIALARRRAIRRLRQDAVRLFAQSTSVVPRFYHEAQLAGLPAPVQRYFRHVLREGQPYLRGLRLRHGGQFKTDLKQDWLAITGEQYMRVSPPGFIWQGTTRWFVARDEYANGHGRLTVHLLGAVPIVHGAGPHYDQGELLRWLAESAWLPTNLLPSDYVTWTAVDDVSARLTCQTDGQALSYLVHFNERGELAQAETERYFGATQLLPWVCRFECYRRWHGVLVPTLVEASWVLDGLRQPYARFIVRKLDYEPLRPF
jgi:hypothetical protein